MPPPPREATRPLELLPEPNPAPAPLLEEHSLRPPPGYAAPGAPAPARDVSTGADHPDAMGGLALVGRLADGLMAARAAVPTGSESPPTPAAVPAAEHADWPAWVRMRSAGPPGTVAAPPAEAAGREPRAGGGARTEPEPLPAPATPGNAPLPDADTLASLVNEVLVEQARRHGVDLT